MQNRIKRSLLRAATTAAIACAAAIMFLPAAASAAPAEAISGVNIRSGPGTSYGIVGQLRAGDDVDVRGCRSGWCYIEQSGPNGYVSANYLRRVGSSSSGSRFEPNFNLSFNFPRGSISIGSGGVSIGVGPGRPTFPDRPGRPHRNDEACFYSGTNYTGSSFCLEEGQAVSSLGGGWDNRISSLRNEDGLRVSVCADSRYRNCRTYTTSARSLGSLDGRISSIRVR